MYDKEIVLDLLENMIDATEKILHRNKDIQTIDDYLIDIMLPFFKTSKTTFLIPPLTIPIVTVFLLESLNY